MTKGNERTYMDREMDAKFGEVHKRLDNQDESLKEIIALQKFTNGKVKKIIMAIAIMVGVAIGISGKEVLPTLIKLFI